MALISKPTLAGILRNFHKTLADLNKHNEVKLAEASVESEKAKAALAKSDAALAEANQAKSIADNIGKLIGSVPLPPPEPEQTLGDLR